MSTRRKTTIEVAAQGPKLPERDYDPAGDVEYFKDYRPPTTSQKQLMLSPEWRTKDLPVEFSYFRADQMQHLDGTPQAKYWRVLQADKRLPAEVVEKHPDLGEMTYKDFFVSPDEPGYPFDGNGLIAYGDYMRVADRECREQYLAVRPIGAKQREQELRARLSAEWQFKPDDRDGLVNASDASRMEVIDPQTGEKLLTSETFSPARQEGNPKIVTSGSILPSPSWSNPQR